MKVLSSAKFVKFTSFETLYVYSTNNSFHSIYHVVLTMENLNKLILIYQNVVFRSFTMYIPVEICEDSRVTFINQ